MDIPCPCGSGQRYAACCHPYHSGEHAAPTPEALMRSRYSAFALGGLGDYLLATWYEDSPNRPDVTPAELDQRDTQWQRLEIINSMAKGSKGEVEFKAHFVENGLPQVLHERSRFTKTGGRWYYVDGVADPRSAPSVGRNDPCPCGSGRKFKKCCGA
nr:YchJ family protein [Phytohalomonas tamaricis]